ncbi:MAG: M1 family aminopeptidase, partial [Salinivirgaceae bacterium]|nr:M1 family aminopeptidase [Salinivirgaceae bacterium]
LLSVFAYAKSQSLGIPKYVGFEKRTAATKMNFQANPETNSYDIIYHRIYWEVDPAEYYIKGSVTSYFKILENNISEICFDLTDALTIDSVTRNGAVLPYTHSNNLVIITLPNVINIGVMDSVTIYYQGMPVANSGFTAFDTANHNGSPILWTLSEPYGAREWWPCKQSLTDKFDSLDIYVKTPINNKVASNGALIFEKTEGSHKLTYWKHRYPMATYLVAIAVTNYESYSQTAWVDQNNKVEILNYLYPENIESAIEDVGFTVKVMELFSKLFIPYPFYKEKYGHAQFAWGGGMEHQTMSFMGGFSEHLITHELAHQWFGDHVTCGSWKDIWINEGFAVFCESVAQEHLYPSTWSEWKQHEIELVVEKAKTGSIFVDDTTDVNRIFNYNLTYKKGGLILQMLRKQVGDDAFFTGLKELLTNVNTAGGFATGEDFKRFVEQAADTNLTQFFNDWYYGQGYPLYDITWLQDINNKMDISVSQITTHSSVPFFALHIPLLLIGQNKDTLVTFHNTENNQNFVYSSDFVVEEVVFDPRYNIVAKHPANINFSITDSGNTDGINIMPNPANETIHIKALHENSFDKIDIINISGKQHFTKNYNAETKKTDIDISSFPVGIYFIRISTQTGTAIKQFVKSS